MNMKKSGLPLLLLLILSPGKAICAGNDTPQAICGRGDSLQAIRGKNDTDQKTIRTENGYDLWLRYAPVEESSLHNQYTSALTQLLFPANSDILRAAHKEVCGALEKMLGGAVPQTDKVSRDGALLVGTSRTIGALLDKKDQESMGKDLESMGAEGFLIRSVRVEGKSCTIIAAGADAGVLYGVFRFLRLLQTHSPIGRLDIRDSPKVQYRILDHWDNLDGTIERGYAGSSLWDWQRLPGYIDPRYYDYARADASVGINGVVLNNVNAKAKSLSTDYIVKTAALAEVFRQYGIKVYLTARFTAPMELGHLKTADPLDPQVRKWWKEKTDEIYKYIPDFGGFLVKANSEGQPGPQDYGRTHADGANALAAAVEPHGGIVMWRAFVYANGKNADRAKQAYEEFVPLDGKFDSNVFLQPKNGPIDFQPREPFHPLFGAMPKTPLMVEFEITQEYLGYATHLVYLAPLFKECLASDTYAQGKESTVADIIEGRLEHHAISGIAGVANTGSDINWCGNPFGQANWYAFGRLAWDPGLASGDIADEWLRMTFTNDPRFIGPVKQMMLGSREIAVNYMTPLGLNHIMNYGTHYGPGPWSKFGSWDAEDYHKADSTGLGVDRTSTGSDAVSQYFPPVDSMLSNLGSCPEKYLLWFHHVPWDYPMPSGRTLWNELVGRYYAGVDSVREMRNVWDRQKGLIDDGRYDEVRQLLAQQEREAVWWRDGCVLYFQLFSHRPIPPGYEQPEHALSYYKTIAFP